MTSVRRLPANSLLDRGALPVEELAAFTHRESSRPRPIYGAHRWFARRFGTAMRALLIGAVTPDSGDFWAGFNGDGLDLSGLKVLDPFCGGGTILYEAHRLGASVQGLDVDPVACAVTSFELAAADYSHVDIDDLVDTLTRTVGKELSASYRTHVDGQERVGLHYFWTQQITCEQCGTTFDGHPSHRLGDDHDGTCWTICQCGSVQSQSEERATVDCHAGCTTRIKVDSGSVVRGVATCPFCHHGERLVDNVRRTGRPTRRLTAIESLPAGYGRRVVFSERVFAAPAAEDLRLFNKAAAALSSVHGYAADRPIAAGELSDRRLVNYGYEHYSDLFNPRQLLHLRRTAQAIRHLPTEQRLIAGLAFSNHTVSNNMMTGYTAKWRQVTPLFTVRSFRHSVRPVEMNPWINGPGRGTLPNAIRRVGKAITYADAPTEFTSVGYKATPRVLTGDACVTQGDARHLAQFADSSVNLVITDPPYLDNIAYSELADFFVPWLTEAGLLKRGNRTVKESLAARDKSEAEVERFTAGMSECFSEVRRVLRPTGRVAFTFQHSSPLAWSAIARALRTAGLEAVTVFPLKGDGEYGLHNTSGSSNWDAVFVCRRGKVRRGAPTLAGAAHVAAVHAHVNRWVERLDLRPADIAVLHRAALAAATTGFANPIEPSSKAISLDPLLSDLSAASPPPEPV